MDIIKIIPYQEGLERLVHLTIRRELIPIFGAGFTAGCVACAGAVPDSVLAKETMIELILDYSHGIFTVVELNDQDFFNIAEIFFERVPAKARSEYFEKYYTDVSLYQNQKDFLNQVNWPYAYTINIDDGIENNANFTPILPYHKFRRPKTSKRLLYKLHGDANVEGRYVDESQENIVFSQGQYLQAITSEGNADIYEAFLSDFSQCNLLFIGCSLFNEPDIQYIYGKSKAFSKEVSRLILRQEKPGNVEQQNLKKHGINGIILVPEYEQFYKDFLIKHQEMKIQQREKIYSYMNPCVETLHKKDKSLELLAGGNIFNGMENKFSKGTLHILRNAIQEIIKELKTNFCVLLKGRRFSGKTYIMCSLAERYKSRDIFYFPSTSNVDEEVVDRILTNSKNSLLLFDSNSITPDVYGLILKSAADFNQKNNKLVIAANSNDNFLLTNLKCDVIELKNTFEQQELLLNSKAADSLGLSRRKAGQTNIDYLYVLKKEQNIDIPFLFSKPLAFSRIERSILIALSALDKLFYSDLIALNFSRIQCEELINKTVPLIELVPTTQEETTRHSTSKLVHNSKLAMIELLKQFTISDISESIRIIVKNFKPDYSRRRLYIEIVLFDTMNQLFSGRPNSKELISTVYTELQPLLENDLHYWLQRAKSIYRTATKKEEFDEAYTYAKKAYLDGKNTLPAKAALTTALISCAIGERVENKERLGYYEEAVILAYEAIFSEHFRFNPRYLQSELPIGKNTHSEKRLTDACKYVQKYSNNVDFLQKGEDILHQFESIRVSAN